MKAVYGPVLFLICLLLCLPVRLRLQTPDPQDVFRKQVEALLEEENYAEALGRLPPALAEAQARSDWASFYSNAAFISNCWFGQSKSDSACVFLEKAIKTLQSAGQGQKPGTARLYNLLAFNHVVLDQYVAAAEAYRVAIRIFEENGTLGYYPAYAYKNAAQIYVRWENYTLANRYFHAALRVDTSGDFRAEVYSQLANGYHYMGDETAVRRYYELGMAEKIRDEENTAHLQACGSTAFAASGDYRQSSQMLSAALGFYQKYEGWEDNVLRCLTALALYAERQSRVAEAAQIYKKAQDFTKKHYSHKSREIAKVYVEQGDFYVRQGQSRTALNFYQQALIQVYPDFNNADLSANPVSDSATVESYCLTAAARKGTALLATSSPAVAVRQNAAECFDLALSAAAVLRRTYGSDSDKILLAANNGDWQRIAALNLMALSGKDPANLDRLFQWNERSRAQALQDQLRRQSGLLLAGIPDSLLQKEEWLRREADEAAGLVASADSAKLAIAQTTLLRTGRVYEDFLKELRVRFPQFQALTTEETLPSAAVIRTALPDTTALLSWFDAGDRYLCLVARRDGLSAFEVRRDTLFDATLARFLKMLADKSGQETNPAAYFADAYFLFQKLLPETALSSVKSLLIIPDGRLCHLPFEALLTASYQGNYGNAPYLLRSKSVQYVWSATLLTLPAGRKPAEKGLLQIAPFAESTREGLALLPNSLRDAPEEINATVRSGAAATAADFLKNAPLYRVLHLSTHASAGGKGVAAIELYDRQLPLTEIYAQRFQASLVSLSACETGTGDYAEGEGVLSIARAFAYAGAQSLVASHWAVNERSTAELFAAFYKNLSTGLPKAEALRQAKLQFLASAELDARKAPFHWAAFTFTGTDGKVDLDRPWWPPAPSLIVGLILAVLAFWYLKRPTKTS